MTTPTKGDRSGFIKTSEPTRTDIVFYTIAYVCCVLMLWPFIVLALLYVYVQEGPQLCWGFLVSHYDRCLYGN